MSSFINIVKAIWKNDRYRSLSILGLYLLFFTIVIIIAKITPSTLVKNETKGVSKINISNAYDFEINVQDRIIKGNYSYSYIYFEYNNITYEYSNEILLPSKFDYMEIIPYMNKNNVYELIKDSEVYSITKFSDKSEAKTYLVNDVLVTTYDSELSKIDIKINDLTYKITYK